MLRPVAPADTPALVALAADTGVFKPHELVALREVLDDFHAANHAHGHRAVAWDDGGRPAGFAYWAPAAMTDRTWDLWWIAVAPAAQGRGLGARLLAHAEAEVGRQAGRLLLIETSSLPGYDPTRRFYLKLGYALAARVPDFYSDGDDKLIFAKRMAGPPG